jgi:hypothetical protein
MVEVGAFQTERLPLSIGGTGLSIAPPPMNGVAMMERRKVFEAGGACLLSLRHTFKLPQGPTAMERLLL